MTDDSEPSTSPSTNDPASSPLTSRSRDSRILRARLAFGTEMFKNGTTIVLRNYLLEGEPIQVALYKDGRIEQRDTASHLRQISNLTINVTVNGMSFELDQHSVLSTPNDLIYAINGADQVQILRTLSKKLEGIDTIAMVHFKYFLNTGVVDTSKAQSITHVGPKTGTGYKLSVQIACLRLAITLKATRFLTHIIREIEYVWLSHDLNLPQLRTLVQVAPYLDRFLLLWTFVMPARSLVQKDRSINTALIHFPHYRNLVRQRAAKYTGRPMMPSGTCSKHLVGFLSIFEAQAYQFCESDHQIVHSFLTGIPDATTGTGLIRRPPCVDTGRASSITGLATPPSDNGNPKGEINSDNREVVMEKRSREQKRRLRAKIGGAF